jgi:hypothetical protein
MGLITLTIITTPPCNPDSIALIKPRESGFLYASPGSQGLSPEGALKWY